MAGARVLRGRDRLSPAPRGTPVTYDETPSRWSGSGGATMSASNASALSRRPLCRPSKTCRPSSYASCRRSARRPALPPMSHSWRATDRPVTTSRCSSPTPMPFRTRPWCRWTRWSASGPSATACASTWRRRSRKPWRRGPVGRAPEASWGRRRTQDAGRRKSGSDRLAPRSMLHASSPGRLTARGRRAPIPGGTPPHGVGDSTSYPTAPSRAARLPLSTPIWVTNSYAPSPAI
jgi:hypothetical protein